MQKDYFSFLYAELLREVVHLLVTKCHKIVH